MAIISEIVEELRQERASLDQAINALSALNGRNAIHSRGTAGATRRLSPAARRRIAAAQRARWARVRAAKAQTSPSKSRPRVVSAAARRKMAAAQKARWARVRAQQNKKAA